MAAQRAAADTDTSENLRLISHTDLTQLNTCFEDRRQILYQFTKVDSSVCGKIKENLVVVKGIFHIDQLHLQLMRTDFLDTDLICFFLFFTITLFFGIILLCSHADHIF